mgnify:CR=1 FL=1
MKVILKEDVKALGKKGDVVEVSDGYARNFILKTGKGVEANGSGKFVAKGDKNSWGNKDRDVIYLDYTMDYAGIHCATKDTLVTHYRGVKAEWFTPVKK